MPRRLLILGSRSLLGRSLLGFKQDSQDARNEFIVFATVRPYQTLHPAYPKKRPGIGALIMGASNFRPKGPLPVPFLGFEVQALKMRMVRNVGFKDGSSFGCDYRCADCRRQ